MSGIGMSGQRLPVSLLRHRAVRETSLDIYWTFMFNIISAKVMSETLADLVRKQKTLWTAVRKHSPLVARQNVAGNKCVMLKMN